MIIYYYDILDMWQLFDIYGCILFLHIGYWLTKIYSTGDSFGYCFVILIFPTLSVICEDATKSVIFLEAF